MDVVNACVIKLILTNSLFPNGVFVVARSGHTVQQLKDTVATLSPAFTSGNFELAFGEKDLAVMNLTLDKVCSSWCSARFGRVFYPKVDIVRAEAGWTTAGQLLDNSCDAARRLCANVVAALSPPPPSPPPPPS